VKKEEDRKMKQSRVISFFGDTDKYWRQSDVRTAGPGGFFMLRPEMQAAFRQSARERKCEGFEGQRRLYRRQEGARPLWEPWRAGIKTAAPEGRNRPWFSRLRGMLPRLTQAQKRSRRIRPNIISISEIKTHVNGFDEVLRCEQYIYMEVCTKCGLAK